MNFETYKARGEEIEQRLAKYSALFYAGDYDPAHYNTLCHMLEQLENLAKSYKNDLVSTQQGARLINYIQPLDVTYVWFNEISQRFEELICYT